MERRIIVSVIIPVYNAEKYLKQCLNSLLTQTFKNIEIICIDDGSTDHSLSLLSYYAKQDSRVLVKHKKNRGAGSARNFGLRYAQGEYLFFADADDFFELNMLEECVKIMNKDESDIVVFVAQKYDQKTGAFSEMPGSIRKEYCPAKSPFYAEEISKHIFNTFQMAPWNKMFRHSFIKKNKIWFQEIPRANDVAFTISTLALANKISVLNKKFVNYRIGTGDSLQQTNDMTPLSFWAAFKEAKNRLVLTGKYARYEQSFLNILLLHIFYNLRSVKTTIGYRDILAYVKYRSDDDFGFMQKPLDYYYDLNLISDFCKIRGKNRRVDFLVSNPKISVIIPTLNSHNYIRECLESVLEQTFIDFEILCIDAGSTDGTLDILDFYAAMDTRVKVILTGDKTYGSQINTGINVAKGKYLTIIKADDYVIPGVFEELYAIAEKNNIDVLKTNYHVFIGEWNKRKYSLKKLLGDSNDYNKVLDPAKDLKGFLVNIGFWSGLYNLSFLKENNINFKDISNTSEHYYQNCGIGLEFCIQCIVLSHNFYFYNKPLYSLRGDNPSTVSWLNNNIFTVCNEHDLIHDFFVLNRARDEKTGSICAFYRFKDYLWTLERVGKEYKLDFLRVFAKDFKTIKDRGELDSGYYTKEEWRILYDIMNDPLKYYNENIIPVSPRLEVIKTQEELTKESIHSKETTIGILQKSNEELKQDKQNLEKDKQNLEKHNEELKQDKQNLEKDKQNLEKHNEELKQDKQNLEKDKQNLEKHNEELKQDKQNLLLSNKNLSDKLYRIKNSKAFYVGEKLATPVRKMRKLFKS